MLFIIKAISTNPIHQNCLVLILFLRCSLNIWYIESNIPKSKNYSVQIIWLWIIDAYLENKTLMKNCISNKLMQLMIWYKLLLTFVVENIETFLSIKIQNVWSNAILIPKTSSISKLVFKTFLPNLKCIQLVKGKIVLCSWVPWE